MGLALGGSVLRVASVGQTVRTAASTVLLPGLGRGGRGPCLGGSVLRVASVGQTVCAGRGGGRSSHTQLAVTATQSATRLVALG